MYNNRVQVQKSKSNKHVDPDKIMYIGKKS